MKRKPMSISLIDVNDEDGNNQCAAVICDDGSIWQIWTGENISKAEWFRLPDIPQPTTAECKVENEESILDMSLKTFFDKFGDDFRLGFTRETSLSKRFETISDFRNATKRHFLGIHNVGPSTIEKLKREIDRRLNV